MAYGSASTKDEAGNSKKPILLLFTRLAVWNAAPNWKRAGFFNIWAGKRRTEQFRARLHADLTAVFDLVTAGVLQPQVAARIPLDRATEAMTLAESHTVVGKVVLSPPTA